MSYPLRVRWILGNLRHLVCLIGDAFPEFHLNEAEFLPALLLAVLELLVDSIGLSGHDTGAQTLDAPGMRGPGD